MNVRLYDRNRDYEMLMRWWVARDHEVVPSNLLPKLGVIVDDIAAGFLYQTDSKLGILENFITSPDASPRQSHQALTEVTRELREFAETAEIETLVVFTKRPSVGKVIEREGFRKTADMAMYSTGV